MVEMPMTPVVKDTNTARLDRRDRRYHGVIHLLVILHLSGLELAVPGQLAWDHSIDSEEHVVPAGYLASPEDATAGGGNEGRGSVCGDDRWI